MDAKYLKAITTHIYHRFPEVVGSQPKVQLQPAPQAKSPNGLATYLLTYRGQAKTSDGRSIPRVVRVVANAQGRILKITTSR
jgi:hypothetical protein